MARSGVVALMAVGWLSLHSASAQPAPARPTFLAVVRDDGLLVPIAISDGETWWNRWPWGGESEEIKQLAVPKSLSDIPADWLPPGLTLPSRWRFLDLNGRKRSIVAGPPVRPDTPWVMDTIALRTDLQPRRNGGSVEEPVGFAIVGEGELGRVTEATPAERRALVPRLVAQVNELERTELQRWWQESHGSDAMPLTLQPYTAGQLGLLHAGTDASGRRFYYLRTEQILRPAPGACGVNLQTSGIVTTRKDGTVVSNTVASWAYGEYCGDAGSWDDVLATLIVRSRLYLIVRVNAEDGHEYVLHDPLSDTIPLQGRWDLRERRRRPTLTP